MQVLTLFDSTERPDISEDGYQVQMAVDAGGGVVSIAIFDHGGAEMIELPADVAHAIADAIKIGVPLASASRLNVH